MKKYLAFAFIVLFASYAGAQGNNYEHFEGTCSSTARTISFGHTSYTIVVNNTDGTNRMYVKFSSGGTITTATAGMIDTAGHRESNAIMIVEKGEYPTLDMSMTGLSIICAGAETATYKIEVLELGQ